MTKKILAILLIITMGGMVNADNHYLHYGSYTYDSGKWSSNWMWTKKDFENPVGTVTMFDDKPLYATLIPSESSIYFTDGDSNSYTQHIAVSNPIRISSCYNSKTGETTIAVFDSKHIYLYNVEDSKYDLTQTDVHGTRGNVDSIAFNSDGSKLVFGEEFEDASGDLHGILATANQVIDSGKTVWLWGTTTYHTKYPVVAVAMSNDGNTIVATEDEDLSKGSDAKGVIIQSTDSGNTWSTLHRTSHLPISVAIGPKIDKMFSNQIIVVEGDGTVISSYYGNTKWNIIDSLSGYHATTVSWLYDNNNINMLVFATPLSLIFADNDGKICETISGTAHYISMAQSTDGNNVYIAAVE